MESRFHRAGDQLFTYSAHQIQRGRELAVLLSLLDGCFAHHSRHSIREACPSLLVAEAAIPAKRLYLLRASFVPVLFRMFELEEGSRTRRQT